MAREFNTTIKEIPLVVAYELDAKGEITDFAVFHDQDYKHINNIVDALSPAVMDTVIAGIEADMTKPESKAAHVSVIRKCKDKDRETGKPWCLYTRDGERLLGRHETKEDAVKQEQAIKVKGGFWLARIERIF